MRLRGLLLYTCIDFVSQPGFSINISLTFFYYKGMYLMNVLPLDLHEGNKCRSVPTEVKLDRDISSFLEDL